MTDRNVLADLLDTIKNHERRIYELERRRGQDIAIPPTGARILAVSGGVSGTATTGWEPITTSPFSVPSELLVEHNEIILRASGNLVNFGTGFTATYKVRFTIGGTVVLEANTGIAIPSTGSTWMTNIWNLEFSTHVGDPADFAAGTRGRWALSPQINDWLQYKMGTFEDGGAGGLLVGQESLTALGSSAWDVTAEIQRDVTGADWRCEQSELLIIPYAGA